MSIMIQKIYSITLSAFLVFGVWGFVPNPAHDIAHAQTCVAGDTVGNLQGYAVTDQVGKIYMSTESWNDDATTMGHPTSSYQFSVSYNRNLNTWDGIGWSPYVGLVDFGGVNADNITNRTARMNDIDGNSGWGNWDPVIDLSGVSYDNDPGGFEGSGWNGVYTLSNGADSVDDLVGLGNIDFSNVQLVEPPCAEAVDLILSSSSTGTASTIYNENCDINNVRIRWTTTDIVPGSCVTGEGLWSGGSGQSKSDNNVSGENASGSITSSNSPQVFTLICTGAGSGDDIVGRAIASCGTTTTDPGGPIDPTDGVVIPEFKEV